MYDKINLHDDDLEKVPTDLRSDKVNATKVQSLKLHNE